MPEPIVALVVAAAENRVIGREGRLPWRMPSDLKAFRRLTLGKPVVMGRRTFVSIGKALDGRDNIVVTRDAAFSPPAEVLVARNFKEALSLARAAAASRNAGEIMVIGGAEVYRQALPLADRLYLTRIHCRPEGDAHFPDPIAEQWRLVDQRELPRNARDEHAATLLVFERMR